MRPLALVVCAVVAHVFSLSAGAQSFSRDLAYRLPETFGSPEADTLDGPASDPWLGRDKAYHAGASFALALGAHVALTEGASMEPELAIPLAGGLALGVGLAKEVADSNRVRKPLFSWRDLAADAVGTGIGLCLAALLSRGR